MLISTKKKIQYIFKQKIILKHILHHNIKHSNTIAAAVAAVSSHQLL